jgi:hypothetical protein
VLVIEKNRRLHGIPVSKVNLNWVENMRDYNLKLIDYEKDYEDENERHITKYLFGECLEKGIDRTNLIVWVGAESITGSEVCCLPVESTVWLFYQV